MIYRDKNGFPISQDDGMDSAVRIGIICMCNKYSQPDIFKIGLYEYDGLLVRCPDNIKTSNEKNFTKDQLLPLIAGFSVYDNYHKYIKYVFYSRAKSFFFCQNIERDMPGSKKYPYPHSFYKDSNPIPDTATELNGIKLNPALGIIEHKEFDGPDPLLPNHIWFLIKAARIYWLYSFALIGIPFFLITLLVHSYKNNYEENQMIAECFVNGKWALRLYRKLNKKWKDVSFKYWNDRGEIEYHGMLVKLVEGA